MEAQRHSLAAFTVSGVPFNSTFTGQHQWCHHSERFHVSISRGKRVASSNPNACEKQRQQERQQQEDWWQTRMELEIGTRVRVLDKGIVMYHFPKLINKPVEVVGKKGTVIGNVSMEKGVKVSAIAPYVVRLDEYPKSKTHFAEDEIEVITDEEEGEGEGEAKN